MLLVSSNVGQHTLRETPIVSFVHWHTTAPPKNPDPAVRQFSEAMYQELLWHMLLRGVDTFFLWCLSEEAEKEIQLLHPVWAAAQEYGEFLDQGEPTTFDVPTKPGPVVSGLRLGDRVLVRRTDFGEARSDEDIEVLVGERKLTVPLGTGHCQILRLQ